MAFQEGTISAGPRSKTLPLSSSSQRFSHPIAGITSNGSFVERKATAQMERHVASNASVPMLISESLLRTSPLTTSSLIPGGANNFDGSRCSTTGPSIPDGNEAPRPSSSFEILDWIVRLTTGPPTVGVTEEQPTSGGKVTLCLATASLIFVTTIFCSL